MAAWLPMGRRIPTYDYKNHIVQVKQKSGGAVIASYRYDALGRRVEKNVGGTVERHILSIWNDPGVVEDLSHVVSVYDGSNTWLQNFVWGDEVDGVQMLEQADVLDYDSDGNTTEITRSFYHRNALGSVMEITDLNQAVVVSYRYDPYGSVTITRGGAPQTTDPLGQHWTFTGRFLDEESWLLYYRARYYDPLAGRFFQRDPLGYSIGPNLFEYCQSHPQVCDDPSGLDTDSDVLDVATTAAVGAAEAAIVAKLGLAAGPAAPLVIYGAVIAYLAPRMLFGPSVAERMKMHGKSPFVFVAPEDEPNTPTGPGNPMVVVVHSEEPVLPPVEEDEPIEVTIPEPEQPEEEWAFDD